MNKRPKFIVYVTVEDSVDLSKAKDHLKYKFLASRISLLEGEGINSIIFSVPMRRLNNVWEYLRKKRGIKKVWLGK